jgi:hypothetical protein
VRSRPDGLGGELGRAAVLLAERLEGLRWRAAVEEGRKRRAGLSAWIMLGPDSKADIASGMPACLVQPSPSATKICATPITGMYPTLSGCCANALVAETSKPAAKAAVRLRMQLLKNDGRDVRR